MAPPPPPHAPHLEHEHPHVPEVTSLRLHASCVAVGDAGVLLTGASGAGKSDLALRLVDRGARLVADDVVVVRAGLAAPLPQGRTLIEVRGVGIVTLPPAEVAAAPVPLRLAVRLDPVLAADPANRCPGPAWLALGDERVPLVTLDARAPSAPLVVERALARVLGGPAAAA